MNTIKVKNKTILFLDLSEGMENCGMSGKSQGILKWMISGDPVTEILFVGTLNHNLTQFSHLYKVEQHFHLLLYL